jgi:hypothetical protein
MAVKLKIPDRDRGRGFSEHSTPRFTQREWFVPPPSPNGDDFCPVKAPAPPPPSKMTPVTSPNRGIPHRGWGPLAIPRPGCACHSFFIMCILCSLVTRICACTWIDPTSNQRHAATCGTSQLKQAQETTSSSSPQEYQPSRWRTWIANRGHGLGHNECHNMRNITNHGTMVMKTQMKRAQETTSAPHWEYQAAGEHESLTGDMA